ncbi:MAG TPA: tetratricopeptide repeat protein [bacterium]|nr:tetratricopeptide repeat protein [bacterium]
MKLSAVVFLYFVLVFFFLELTAEDTSNSFDSKVDSLRKALNEVSQESLEIELKYLSPLTINKEYVEPVANRLRKAEFYYQKGDYISSGSLFYSIVISREEKDSIWEQAVYKLSESLFRNKNYISAARYYEMLLTEVSDTKYKTECLKRLIASSYHLGEYSVAKKYYSKFLEIGYDISQDQELIYYLGKSLFFDNQIDESQNVFLTQKSTSSFYPQSLYFLGTIFYKKGDPVKALKYFEEIAGISDDNKFYKFQRIYELSILAAARISFEQGDFAKSVKYYVLLDKKSEYFPEAYYELCWTYIKKEEYGRAVEALRLIKYIAPDSIVSPRAEILEGSLLIKLKKYGEAMVIFDSVVKKYSSIKDELQLIDSKSFSDSYRKSRESFVLSPYSPVVRSLLKNNKKFANAMKLGDDVANLEEEIIMVDQLEKKIGSIVNNQNAASLFPPLKEGSKSAIYLQNRLVSIRNDVTELKKEIAWSGLSEEDRTEYAELEKKKNELSSILEKNPIQPDQIEKDASDYAKMIINLEENLHLITIQTNSLYDQLEATGIYYLREKKASAAGDKISERINNEKDEIKKIIDSLQQYKSEIEQEKNRLVLGGDIISRFIISRNSLNFVIKKQSDILLRSTADVADKEQIIDGLLKDTQKIDDDLGEFYSKLNDAVKDIIGKIRVSYEQEKTNLNEYKSELMDVKREINEIASLAMYSNISKVRASFVDLVLQADLGIIDVAWEKKEENTADLLKYRTQRALEIKSLYLNTEDDAE